jgi:hypothetical protein
MSIRASPASSATSIPQIARTRYATIIQLAPDTSDYGLYTVISHLTSLPVGFLIPVLGICFNLFVQTLCKFAPVQQSA